MRTTVTIDPEVEKLLRQLMRQRGLGFKEALNAALRRGLQPVASFPERKPLPAFAMGLNSKVNLDKALALAGELEDEELIRKLQVRK